MDLIMQIRDSLHIQLQRSIFGLEQAQQQPKWAKMLSEYHDDDSDDSD